MKCFPYWTCLNTSDISEELLLSLVSNESSIHLASELVNNFPLTSCEYLAAEDRWYARPVYFGHSCPSSIDSSWKWLKMIKYFSPNLTKNCHCIWTSHLAETSLGFRLLWIVSRFLILHISDSSNLHPGALALSRSTERPASKMAIPRPTLLRSASQRNLRKSNDTTTSWL